MQREPARRVLRADPVLQVRGGAVEDGHGYRVREGHATVRTLVAGRNRERNIWPTMALSGKNSSSGTRLPMISDERRPQMSESLPHNGRE